jgi:hypothetical protein
LQAWRAGFEVPQPGAAALAHVSFDPPERRNTASRGHQERCI